MDPSYYWLFMLFLLIPLSRIIVRLISRRGDYKVPYTERTRERYTNNGQDLKSYIDPSKRTREMQVLGLIHQGANTFEKIQGSTNMDASDLESVLADLEARQMIKVREKRGVFGLRIELYATNKGFKEYYSK